MQYELTFPDLTFRAFEASWRDARTAFERASRRARAALAAAPATVAIATAVLAVPPAASAKDEAPAERLRVTDPYVELRTGPGRDFPIFYVAERDEWIEIELRHTDWFKVRTVKGKEGWVNRAQLASTLTEAGASPGFREIALDDYLRRRVEFGAAYGRLRADPMLKVFGAYNLADTLAVEGTIGQVQGDFSGTSFWHVNLLIEPWSDRRLGPFFGVGFGKFNNIPNASLVGASPSDAKMGNASIGLRYHLSERFIARLDWTAYTAFNGDTRIDEYRATTFGLSFFF
ncbi:MAG TPA: SH3 domain-containing protein [Burkholderiaceae bacterium]|nr:SH3 domain-containing protein [Burkholderiaceae bacterium]